MTAPYFLASFDSRVNEDKHFVMLTKNVNVTPTLRISTLFFCVNSQLNFFLFFWYINIIQPIRGRLMTMMDQIALSCRRRSLTDWKSGNFRSWQSERWTAMPRGKATANLEGHVASWNLPFSWWWKRLFPPAHFHFSDALKNCYTCKLGPRHG